LLMPQSNEGSEVIINGIETGTMEATRYFKERPALKEMIAETFNRIHDGNDVVVIEGAGSPAEINLRDNDIVNMGMAEMANANVLLVADIDRGGIFASLYGTILLLEPEERARIKGMIVNKFRGDPSLLEPGLRMI